MPNIFNDRALPRVIPPSAMMGFLEPLAKIPNRDMPSGRLPGCESVAKTGDRKRSAAPRRSAASRSRTEWTGAVVPKPTRV
jgi:hypothetical protein